MLAFVGLLAMELSPWRGKQKTERRIENLGSQSHKVQILFFEHHS